MEKQNTNTKNNNINLNQVHPICEYSLYFDGCSKGNPGPSGIGAVIYKNGDEISASCENIGNRTNNESEYCALIIGLEEAIKLGITSLCVYGDSLLVINQANKVYKVKNENLLVLYEKFRALKCKFKYITFTHIYRTHNKRADQLANMGLIKNIEEKEEEKEEEKDEEKEEDDDFVQVLDVDWKEESFKKKNSNINQLKINTFFPKINQPNINQPKINSFFPQINQHI
jgi:ribonuclease HI